MKWQRLTPDEVKAFATEAEITRNAPLAALVEEIEAWRFVGYLCDAETPERLRDVTLAAGCRRRRGRPR